MKLRPRPSLSPPPSPSQRYVAFPGVSIAVLQVFDCDERFDDAHRGPQARARARASLGACSPPSRGEPKNR